MSQGSDEWYDQPRAIAGVTLYNLREKMRAKNLHDSEDPPLEISATPPTGDAHNVRTADGKYNDLKCPRMGSAGIRLGRNVPLEDTFPDIANMMTPNERTVTLRRSHEKPFTP